MRVNIYSQELLLNASQELSVELGSQKSNTGLVYSFVRLYLHSTDKLHHPPKDDDRSAITFWLPKSMTNRLQFSDQLRQLADLVDQAPSETGLD